MIKIENLNLIISCLLCTIFRQQMFYNYDFNLVRASFKRKRKFAIGNRTKDNPFQIKN